MKNLETRRLVAQREMFYNLIDNTKQVRYDILPVCQRCIDIKFKPLFGVIKSYVYFAFFPTSSKTMEHSTKR